MNKLNTDYPCYLELWLMYVFMVNFPIMHKTPAINSFKISNWSMYQFSLRAQ